MSDDPKALCVDVDQWPNRAGQVDGGSQSMWLLVDGETIPGKSAPYSTYCPGGCRYLEVKPGQRLIGFIGYDQFEGDPTSHSNKTLNFPTRRVPQI